MQDLIVSISENTLKVSTIENGQFRGVSASISENVVKNHEIINTEEIVVAIRDLISTITKKGLGSLGLNYVVEPQDVILRFITVNKNGGNLEDQLTLETRAKVKDLPLEEMYFGFLKIAPFVYQFVGIKKSLLETYIDIANKLGIGLRTVYPWILLLPKVVGVNEPAIFISKAADKQVVALSEFNGVFFSGVYEKEKSTQELQKLVTDLSIYKRSSPISKVYIYNTEGFSLDPKYEVLKIEIPNSDLEEAKGYEMHLLVNQMAAKDSNAVFSKLNLLTHLPVPVIKHERSLVPVYVGGVVLVVLFAGIFGIRLLNSNKEEKTTLAPIPQTSQEVLSQEVAKPQAEAPQQEAPKPERKKEDLKISVENGAGVSGMAAKTKEFLEKAGFKVDTIGNSDDPTRTNTLIQLKQPKAGYQDLLKDAMKDSFSIEVQTNLEDSSQFDAVIVVGSDAKL